MGADGSRPEPAEPGQTTVEAARGERYGRLCLATGVVVLATGAAVLAGWALDLVALKRVQDGYVAMTPLTAAGLVLAGLALVLLQPAQPGPVRRGAGAVAALLVVLLGVGAAAHHIFGVEPGVGRLLFPAAVEAEPAAPDPWPVPTTAVAFPLAGLALLLLAVHVRRRYIAAQALALAVAFLALHTLILYVYDIGVLLGLELYPPMALHTALALLVLSLGILLARPDRGLMRTVTADDIGGQVARRLLPVALLVPVLFGLVRGLGVQAGLFDAVHGLTLVLALSVAAWMALLWWTAELVHRLEAARQRARAERERAAARLRLALEAGQMGTWDWNVRTGEITWSRQLEAIHGFEPDSIPRSLEDSWKQAVPEDQERVREAVYRAVRTGEPYRLEFRIVRPDGEVRWVEAWGSVFRSAAGEPEHVACLYRDVTERVEAARAQAHLAAIVESSNDAILSGDIDGTITSWNRGAERIYGYSAAEIVGRHVSKLSPPGMESEIREMLERLRRGERIEHYETVRQAKRGRKIDVALTISPIRDEAGRVIGWSTISRDVAEEKRVRAERERLLVREREARAEAEAARRDAERHARQEAALRRAAEAVTATYMPEEVMRRIADTALEATGASGAFVLRIDREARELRVEAAAGKHVPPEDRRFAFRGSATERVLERGAPEKIGSGADADGRVPSDLRSSCPRCNAIIVPLVNSGEQIGSLVLVRERERGAFDTEELERASTFAHLASLALRKIHLLEDAERRRLDLERLLESRGRLMRGFSHDVKNPLGAADGQLELLDADVLGALSPRQREGVERARASIRTALRLIDSLVELARAEAGRFELERAPMDVRGVAHEVIEEYRAAAEDKGLELEFRFAKTMPVIRSDVDRIRQILANLVVNAVKYTDRGRVVVTVELREDDPRAPGPGPWLVVEVSDTGPGIPQEKHEEVFGEFVRLEPGKAGAGLGLAISRRLARLLGGDITLESEEGRGSTFTLWLPQERPAGVTAEDEEARAPERGERRHPIRPPGLRVDRARTDRAADGGAPARERPGGDAAAGREDEVARLRARVEQQERKLAEHRLLADATATLASSLDYEESLERLARLAVPRLADLCVVDVLVDGGEIRCVAAVHNDPARQELADRLKEFPPDPHSGPIAHALLARRPQIVRHVTDDWLRSAAGSREHLRVLRALHPRSTILVPLVARGRTLGLLILARTATAEPYDEEDLRLADELGRRAAIIIDNARLYEAAEAASQAKSDFLAVMSHELRTPLTAIVGYQELLAAGLAGAVTDEQMKYLRRIGVSAQHLREVIEEILTFSGLEAGRETVRLERTDLALLARDAADVVEPAAREKGLTFDVALPPAPLTAWTDPPKVRRILLNLLNNAASFTDQGGIRFALEREDDTAVFRIKDTGIGIAPASLEKVFEPFWQEQRGLTREVGGTGLGLTVARRLARMLDGDVTVESTPGEGSTFSVRLPLRPRARPGAAESPRRESRDRSG